MRGPRGTPGSIATGTFRWHPQQLSETAPPKYHSGAGDMKRNDCGSKDDLGTEPLTLLQPYLSGSGLRRQSAGVLTRRPSSLLGGPAASCLLQAFGTRLPRLPLAQETRVSPQGHSAILEAVLRQEGVRAPRGASAPGSLVPAGARCSAAAPRPRSLAAPDFVPTRHPGLSKQQSQAQPSGDVGTRASFVIFYLCALSADHIAAPCHRGDQAASREVGRVFSFPSVSPPWGPLAPVPAAAAGAGGAMLSAVRGRQTVSFSAAGRERAAGNAVWSPAGGGQLEGWGCQGCGM